MKSIFILYIFLLFLLFNKNPYISFHISHKQILFSSIINAFLFTIIFYIVFQYIHPMIESMIVFNEPNINNDLVKNMQNSDSNDWVIIPPPIKELPIKPPNFTELPIQCAADYGNNVACCGQPPVIVPYENTCKQEMPYCNGYVANEKWGVCQTERPNIPSNVKLVSPPPEKRKDISTNSDIEIEPHTFTCREVAELKDGDHYTIIARFGKYVLWYANRITSSVEEKNKIDKTGYMLLQSDSIPQLGSIEFDGYNIDTCIQNMANKYVKNKMSDYEKTTNNVTVIFPSKEEYSNTFNSNHIVNKNNRNIFSYSKSEFNGINMFLVLIDPKI